MIQISGYMTGYINTIHDIKYTLGPDISDNVSYLSIVLDQMDMML